MYALTGLLVLISIAGSLLDIKQQLTILATTHLAFYSAEAQREIDEAEKNE